MNFTTIAMLLLAWQLLGNKKKDGEQASAFKPDLSSIGGFLNDDTKSLLDCVGKLSDKEASKEDKTGAILQMVMNPAVMDFAGNLFGSGKNAAEDSGNTAKSAATNSEGYRYGEKFSDESKKFFHPIDNVADTEIKQKLYWFYDNWYLK